MRDGRDYCVQRVRTYDYDRYFASLFAPRDLRSDLVVLYAFNLEIASLRELVGEALLGQMRLEWWRDAVAAIYEGRTVRHAIVEELGPVVHRHDLPQAEMDGLIAARLRDFDGSSMETVAAVEDYARGTSGALAGLACRICRGDVPPPAIREAGMAWGLAGLPGRLPSVPLAPTWGGGEIRRRASHLQGGRPVPLLPAVGQHMSAHRRRLMLQIFGGERTGSGSRPSGSGSACVRRSVPVAS